MCEPALKCENNSILSKNCLFLLKHHILSVLALGGNLDFPDFLHSKFYNINYYY